MQSAASIKAASLDLTNNLKATSQEVKALKHAVALAKHDLNLVPLGASTKHATSAGNERTLNPFASLTANTSSAYNQLQQQIDELQNQLTITEKVKKSLEEELVAVRIQHQQQLTEARAKAEEAAEQRNSVLQGNEELHDRVDKLST